jgi:hypothetical protein
MKAMGGSRIRIFGVLLIAFLAIGAQCVAFCEAQRASLPPCHQTGSTCAPAQAAADAGVKQLKVELIAVATVPLLRQSLPHAPAIPSTGHPTPPLLEPSTTTVLRI